jgi:hypothetical protein
MQITETTTTLNSVVFSLNLRLFSFLEFNSQSLLHRLSKLTLHLTFSYIFIPIKGLFTFTFYIQQEFYGPYLLVFTPQQSLILYQRGLVLTFTTTIATIKVSLTNQMRLIVPINQSDAH